MDIEIQLRKLESLYRRAQSAALAAKAHYVALIRDASSTPASIERAQFAWRKRDSLRREIAARMGEVEDADIAS